MNYFSWSFSSWAFFFATDKKGFGMVLYGSLASPSFVRDRRSELFRHDVSSLSLPRSPPRRRRSMMYSNENGTARHMCRET
eukprot:scaffold29956_cov76-Amphora_coffeaeformis.AAC.1